MVKIFFSLLQKNTNDIMRSKSFILLFISLLVGSLEPINSMDFKISQIEVDGGGGFLDYLIKKKVKRKTDNKLTIKLQDSVALVFFKDRKEPVIFAPIPNKRNLYYKQKGSIIATLLMCNDDKVYLNFCEVGRKREINILLLPV